MNGETSQTSSNIFPCNQDIHQHFCLSIHVPARPRWNCSSLLFRFLHFFMNALWNYKIQFAFWRLSQGKRCWLWTPFIYFQFNTLRWISWMPDWRSLCPNINHVNLLLINGRRFLVKNTPNSQTHNCSYRGGQTNTCLNFTFVSEKKLSF